MGKGAWTKDDRFALKFVVQELSTNEKNYKKVMEKKVVKAPLPETYSWGISNELNQPFEFLKFKSDAVRLFGVTLKANLDRGISERQYWRSTENRELTLEFNYEAYNSAFEDVLKPTQDLAMLSAAVESSVLWTGRKAMTPVDGYWNAPPTVSVYFGDFMRFYGCYLKDVTIAYSNKLDNEFNPMSANVSVTVVPQDPVGWWSIVGDYHYNGGGFSIKKSPADVL